MRISDYQTASRPLLGRISIPAELPFSRSFVTENLDKWAVACGSTMPEGDHASLERAIIASAIFPHHLASDVRATSEIPQAQKCPVMPLSKNRRPSLNCWGVVNLANSLTMASASSSSVADWCREAWRAANPMV